METKKIIMHFHCAGVVSDEEVEVIKETKTTITVDDSDNERVFDKKTGKCLNDNTVFGARRTIDPQ